MTQSDIAARRDTTAGRSRLSAQERRTQLVEIGLELLRSTPIHDLALDEVAAEAGISRSLLFHYFPTKRDYYLEVVRAAGNRLQRQPRIPEGVSREERVRFLVEGFLRLVDSRRESYSSLVRGASGGDPSVIEMLADIRGSLVPRWLEASETPASPQSVLLVRGWLALLEEVALAWSPADQQFEDVRDALVDAFFRLVEPSTPEA